ncbi:hypothetical protein L211DRAFT_477566 [Terfezia boudieri ATCC MYA-4762]|uniref:Uncharacterized protein n=1 Tax=Terfezia boudieri ATCC MYA-4762 TaxID=1051890 RepID=A0A3N4MGR7_9PEZI|nr:hypothetical protein L211DRAFT_477566 [Terfezia boudieri ATCC MYA-4762]
MARREGTGSPGPLSMFTKRSSFHGRPRQSTWSVSERFKSRPIEDFVIEELGNKSGHLVYGPISSFNGSVAMNVKSPLPKVTVSVTFRGLTEYNGRTLAFFNVTEDLWSGDLELGPKTFSFTLKFPPVNLPPTSHEPYINYNFIAQIKPVARATTNETPNVPTPLEAKTYISKPHPLTFMPYVDPFAKSRFDIPDEPVVRRFPVESMPITFPMELPQAMGRGTGGRPTLTLTTQNLPPSPSLPLQQQKPREITPQKNPGVEKSAIIMDGNSRILGKLKVVTAKSVFVPGDEVNMTITLTLPKGTPVPKNLTTKIVERRTLGFEDDEDADQNIEGSDDEGKHRKTSCGKIFSRTLTSRKYPLAKLAKPKPIENRPITASSNRTGLEGYTMESGIEVTESFSVRIPTFRTFIDDSLLPSASLPLGPALKDTSPASTIYSSFSRINSIKGKEPMRPSTPRSHAATTLNSPKPGSAVHGLHYIVVHSLNVQVPLTAGLMRKSSGTLDVDLELILGNKTPDVYSYKSNNGSMEMLKVSTPELVVVPPGQNTGHDLLGGGLMHQDSKTSFERKPSPLRNMDSFDGADDVSPGATGGSMANGSSPGHIRTHSRPVSLRATSSRVSFMSIEPPEIQWKKGEKFPTLNDSREKPVFWTQQ